MNSSIIYLVIIFVSFCSLAQSPKPLDRSTNGCPEDSICSSEFGTKLENWKVNWNKTKNTSQKNQLIKNIGIPISFYTKLGPDTGNKNASWHSKCEEHKKKKIFKSLGLVKKIEKSDLQMFQPIHVKQRTKEWNSYYVPLDFSLIEVKNSKLLGFIEREDQFIPLSISQKGEVEVLSKLPGGSFQTLQDRDRVQCPSDIKALEPFKDYYLDRYCHYLKSGKKKSALIALRYWSCP